MSRISSYFTLQNLFKKKDEVPNCKKHPNTSKKIDNSCQTKPPKDYSFKAVIANSKKNSTYTSQSFKYQDDNFRILHPDYAAYSERKTQISDKSDKLKDKETPLTFSAAIKNILKRNLNPILEEDESSTSTPLFRKQKKDQSTMTNSIENNTSLNNEFIKQNFEETNLRKSRSKFQFKNKTNINALYKTVSDLKLAFQKKCLNPTNEKCDCEHCNAIGVVNESLKHPILYDSSMEENEEEVEQKPKKRYSRRAKHIHEYEYLKLLLKLRLMESRIQELEEVLYNLDGNGGLTFDMYTQCNSRLRKKFVQIDDKQNRSPKPRGCSPFRFLPKNLDNFKDKIFGKKNPEQNESDSDSDNKFEHISRQRKKLENKPKLRCHEYLNKRKEGKTSIEEPWRILKSTYNVQSIGIGTADLEKDDFSYLTDKQLINLIKEYSKRQNLQKTETKAVRFADAKSQNTEILFERNFHITNSCTTLEIKSNEGSQQNFTMTKNLNTTEIKESLCFIKNDSKCNETQTELRKPLFTMMPKQNLFISKPKNDVMFDLPKEVPNKLVTTTTTSNSSSKETFFPKTISKTSVSTVKSVTKDERPLAPSNIKKCYGLPTNKTKIPVPSITQQNCAVLENQTSQNYVCQIFEPKPLRSQLRYSAILKEKTNNCLKEEPIVSASGYDDGIAKINQKETKIIPKKLEVLEKSLELEVEKNFETVMKIPKAKSKLQKNFIEINKNKCIESPESFRRKPIKKNKVKMSMITVNQVSTDKKNCNRTLLSNFHQLDVIKSEKDKTSDVELKSSKIINVIKKLSSKLLLKSKKDQNDNSKLLKITQEEIKEKSDDKKQIRFVSKIPVRIKDNLYQKKFSFYKNLPNFSNFANTEALFKITKDNTITTKDLKLIVDRNRIPKFDKFCLEKPVMENKSTRQSFQNFDNNFQEKNMSYRTLILNNIEPTIPEQQSNNSINNIIIINSKNEKYPFYQKNLNNNLHKNSIKSLTLIETKDVYKPSSKQCVLPKIIESKYESSCSFLPTTSTNQKTSENQEKSLTVYVEPKIIEDPSELLSVVSLDNQNKQTKDKLENSIVKYMGKQLNNIQTNVEDNVQQNFYEINNEFDDTDYPKKNEVEQYFSCEKLTSEDEIEDKTDSDVSQDVNSKTIDKKTKSRILKFFSKKIKDSEEKPKLTKKSKEIEIYEICSECRVKMTEDEIKQIENTNSNLNTSKMLKIKKSIKNILPKRNKSDDKKAKSVDSQSFFKKITSQFNLNFWRNKRKSWDKTGTAVRSNFCDLSQNDFKNEKDLKKESKCSSNKNKKTSVVKIYYNTANNRSFGSEDLCSIEEESTLTSEEKHAFLLNKIELFDKKPDDSQKGTGMNYGSFE